MARPTTDAYDLTDAEKRDLIKLIEQGRPLPDKYRFALFADKREVELVWNGKTREVCNGDSPVSDSRAHRRAAEGKARRGRARPRHRRASGKGMDK